MFFSDINHAIEKVDKRKSVSHQPFIYLDIDSFTRCKFVYLVTNYTLNVKASDTLKFPKLKLV